MDLNTQKADVISLTHTKNSVNFNYYIGDVLILRTDSVKYLGVAADTKFNLHQHVNYIKT
jgi:hypothetical protein